MRDRERPDDNTPVVWTNNLDAIDARIESYAARVGDSVRDDFEDLGREIHDWMDRQEMDEPSRRDWDELKLNSKLYLNKVKHRFQELVDAGRIRLSHWTGGESE